MTSMPFTPGVSYLKFWGILGWGIPYPALPVVNQGRVLLKSKDFNIYYFRINKCVEKSEMKKCEKASSYTCSEEYGVLSRNDDVLSMKFRTADSPAIITTIFRYSIMQCRVDDT